MNGAGAADDGSALARRRVLRATLLALAGAVLALLAFVLPAEYGVDPLGTGRMTGVLALSGAQQRVFAPADGPHLSEQVVFRLEPFESVEYKYRLEAGQGMTFEWRATSAVLAELHAEPDGAPEGFAESYRRERGETGAGSYQARFPGWHGWFWENRGVEAVTVTLDAAGFFSAARTYGGGRVREEAKGRADAQ